MRRWFAWMGPDRRWTRRLLFVGIAAILLAAVSPFLWAAYHRLAGERALERYHSDEALVHLNKCLNIWPWSRSARVHLLAARAARREGDFPEAAHHLHECQDTLHDTSAEALLEWAMLHAAEGADLDAVEEHLERSARQHPDQVPLILEALIQGYLGMSRIVHALHYAEEWLEREPDNVQALYLRGNIHRQVGAAQKAIPDYRRVLELDAEHPQARRRLAIALLEVGRYDEALQHFEMIRRNQPGDVEVLVNLAMCRDRLGQGDEANALLDAVLAQDPDHGLALRTRGWIALNADRLPEAEKWLRRAVRVQPHDYKTQYWLSVCLRQQHKTEEADVEEERAQILNDRRERQSEIYLHLMSQKPHDAALQCELGILCIQLGKPEIGEGWLLNAVRLDERHAPALKALAAYYKERGDLDNAEEYHRRARSVSP